MILGLVGTVAFIIFLLFLSGFFSGSETALTAASPGRMASMEKEGNKKAALVNRIHMRKDRMIGALLLGNNLVNILAAALATSVLIQLVGEAGVVYATLIMTLMVLIFAEVLPKTYALHHSDKMAMTVAPVIRFLMIFLGPIVETITWIVRKTLKLLGSDLSLVDPSNHIEALRGMIELHRDEQDISSHEQRAMLHSVLDLADVTVEEIMTHRRSVSMIDAGQPIENITEEMLKSPYSRLPIWKDDSDNIVGVVHVKALLKQMQSFLREGSDGQIEIENIASEPWFIPETTHLFDQLQAFRERREHFAIVVDEYGSVMGIVTLEDILEEIVGEIEDEMDDIRASVKKQADSYVFEGEMTIRDMNREFDWDLPDDNDYATVAGLILHESQTLPEVGQMFLFYGFKFEVMRKQRNQITLIRVTPPALEPDSDDQEL